MRPHDVDAVPAVQIQSGLLERQCKAAKPWRRHQLYSSAGEEDVDVAVLRQPGTSVKILRSKNNNESLIFDVFLIALSCLVFIKSLNTLKEHTDIFL